MERTDDPFTIDLRGKLEAKSEHWVYQNTDITLAFAWVIGNCDWNGSSV